MNNDDSVANAAAATEHRNDGFDIFTDAYEFGQAEIWESIRRSGCPVAHTEKWGGAWMVVDYEDVHNVLHDTATFSSRAVEIAGAVPPVGTGLVMPPVTSDPPVHAAQRELLAPFFTPAKVQSLEPFIRARAKLLIGAMAARGHGDAMADFTRPFTLSVLTHLLDVPADNQDRFADWAMRIMRYGPTDEKARSAAINEVLKALGELIDARVANPGSDIISYLSQATLDGKPLTRKHQLGSLMLLVMAGADTTWNTLGSALWYLARHPEERARLIAQPALLTSGIEEFLRVFAPVTLARITTGPADLQGRCPVANERVMVPLAAANRDPKIFDSPTEVQLGRKPNRHITFGSGTHRCLGSHLARLELKIGLQEWLGAIPNYEMADAEPVRWSLGQVRGPEDVRIRVIPA